MSVVLSLYDVHELRYIQNFLEHLPPLDHSQVVKWLWQIYFWNSPRLLSVAKNYFTILIIRDSSWKYYGSLFSRLMMNRTIYTKQSGVLRWSYGIIIVLNMINYYINTILLSSGKYDNKCRRIRKHELAEFSSLMK